MTTENQNTETKNTEETIYAVVHFHNQDEVSISPFRSLKDAEDELINTAQAEVDSFGDNEDDDDSVSYFVNEEDFEDGESAMEALKKSRDSITINGNEDSIEIFIKKLTLK